MADIQPEINVFKSAVYGEEVRDSMVSLANKLNSTLETQLSNIGFENFAPSVYTNTHYIVNTLENASQGKIEFLFQNPRPKVDSIVEISYDSVLEQKVSAWTVLSIRLYKTASGGFIYKSQRPSNYIIDNNTKIGATVNHECIFSNVDTWESYDELYGITLLYENNFAGLLDFSNLVIKVDGKRVEPPSPTSASYLSVESDDEPSTLATRKWVISGYGSPKEKTYDMSRCLLPKYYSVFDNSSKNKLFGYRIPVDYLAPPDISKDVLFNNGSDMYIMMPKSGQSSDVETETKEIRFSSKVYDIEPCTVTSISTKSSVPNTRKHVLVIGDSVTGGYGANEPYHRKFARYVYEEDIDFGRDSGLVMLGSIGKSYSFEYEGQTYTKVFCHEGRSGWSAKDYHGNKDFATNKNPFYDEEASGDCKFSIAKWLQRFRTMDSNGNRLAIGADGIGTEITSTNINNINVKEPDIVVIELGHNDFYVATTVEQFLQYIRNMITVIRTQIPDAYVVVFATMPLLYCSHPELYPDYDVPVVSVSSYRYKYYDVASYWRDFVGSNTDDKILVFPAYNITPTVDAFKWDVVNDEMPRPLMRTKNEYGTSHPYEPGHVVYAHQLHGIFKYIQTL